MASHLLEEDLVAEGTLPTAADTYLARRLVALANRTSRRSFLGTVGRASLALMGGSFVDIWLAESARAACTWEGPFGQQCRATCLCTDLIGTNTCPNCCSGFWRSCLGCSNIDSCCSGGQTHYVKLYDCCATCGGNCGTSGSPVGCNCNRSQSGCAGGNDTCCNVGYCNDGGCSGKFVRCVRKVCTTNVCTVAPC